MVSDKIKEVNSRYIFIGGGIGAKYREYCRNRYI